MSEWWVATDLIIASNSPVSLLFGISPAVSLPSTRRCALPTSVFDNDLQNLPNCIFSVSFYANTDIRWKHEVVLETLQKHSCAILSISRFSWDPIYRLAICKPGSTDSNINFTCYQGLIQPVSLGGAISVIFGIQVSSRVHYCIREMKYTSQHCCDKTMDGQMALYRECCFPNCTKSWWTKLLP